MSKSSVSVHVENYLFGQVDDVRIPLHGLAFSARLGIDTFAIDQLTLELGDIDISPAAMPPAGLRLRQVALALLPPDGGASFAGNMFGHKETRTEGKTWWCEPHQAAPRDFHFYARSHRLDDEGIEFPYK